MIESLREHPEGAVLEADVAIVGAGAAGIGIARELRGSGLRVLVAESGGLELEPETQALYEAEVVGDLDYQPAATRMRFFGGSTNCWTGFCTPLDPPDFEARSWIPHSGWPITRAELEPYYVRAQELLELGPFAYDADGAAAEGAGLQRFRAEVLRNTLWQHSPPTRFGTRYRADLERAPDVRLLLHANLTAIRLSEDGAAVRELELGSLEGRRARLRAWRYVLAAGGIENPRLLLASPGREGRGVGNRHDRVGRYFMEHVVVPAATVTPGEPADWFDRYTGITGPGGVPSSAAIGPSLPAQRARRILNAASTLAPGRTDLDAGYLALGRIRRSLARGEWPDDFGEEACRVLSDLDDVARGIRAKLSDEPYRPVREDTGASVLNVHVEQAPDPESRVRLGEERDPLGVPRAALAWRLGELERRTVRVTARLVGQELARLGLGRLRQDAWLEAEDFDWPILVVKCHHAGTTRMADDPRYGVVDARCRVHGLDNLYVAGSSVFPTSGFANPTLTLVALALRLADDLRATAG